MEAALIKTAFPHGLYKGICMTAQALELEGRFWRVSTGLVLALSLALRLFGIGWGMPDYSFSPPASKPYHNTFHMDEDNFLWGLAQMRPSEGDFDVHDYHWGTLQHYLIYGALLLGSAAGVVPQPWEGAFRSGDTDMLPRLYILGRLVSVVAGVACTLVVIGLGAALAGRMAGLGAGVAYAFSPLAVVEAHYLTSDVTMSALVAAATLSSVRAVQRGRFKWLVMAGLLLGLATAAKYSAVFAATALLVAQLGVWRSVRAAAFLSFLLIFMLPWLATMGGFVLGEPYTLIMPAAVLEGLEAAKGNALDLSLGIGPPLEMVGWQALNLAGLGLTWPIALLSLVGLIIMVAQVVTARRKSESRLGVVLRLSPSNLRDASMLSPAIVVLVAIAGLVLGLSLSRFHMLRYSQPLMPLLAVAAGVAWVAVPRPALRWAAGALAVFVAAWITLGQLSLMLAPHPANVLLSWLRDHVRPGQQVARVWPEYPLLDDRLYDLIRLDPWQPDLPPGIHPDYIILDDMQYGPPTDALTGLLAREYKEVARFSAKPHICSFAWDEGTTPHDWKYSHPTFMVYTRDQ
ncbi:MAG: glycosyltransferase family 39 protein [Chloroflexota bacterium]|nr:glycosyltransferase family 39 protein [Chloroflexota bacterium]MDQ5866175.1 glycosyltransferase family 39 protein [Chloroflexota bacterium]